MTSAAKVLQEYLSSSDRTNKDLADASGVDKTTICKVLTGARHYFSREAAVRIHAVSPSKLPLAELLGLPSAPRRRKSA